MMKQQRTLIVLAVAVITAGIAAFAVYQAVQRMPVKEVEIASVPVVVAARPITIGMPITRDDVKVLSWPAKSQVPGTFADPDDVINRGALETIGENELITARKIAGPEAGAGLPPIIPQGMRAVAVRVNDVISLGGWVMPGTRVDVIATVRDDGSQRNEPMSRTVVSNVLVLSRDRSVDTEAARRGEAGQGTVVTLAVLPLDVEKIALAQNEGKITLALRNPLDIEPTETPGVKLPVLMRGPGGQPVVDPVQRRVVRVTRPEPKVEPIVPPPPPRRTIEIIKAAKITHQEVTD